MNLTMNLGDNSYDIIIERGAIKNAYKHFDLDRRVLILTDDGVPVEYAKTIADQCKEPTIMTVPHGESSKSFKILEMICNIMLKKGFTRGDAAVAVGGGVVGDLCGFAASCYQRGIDFYNVPTTLLSQVDSSIGGKTAINLGNVKNCVGAFYQPNCVLIDPDTLKTLDARQFSSGLAESIKMAATSSKELFELIEKEDINDNIEKIIYGSLMIKKTVVEQDERESGLRRVLNFGHTVGHGIESCAGLSGLLHGECVALGMLYLCSDSVRARLIPTLEKAKLPTSFDIDFDKVVEAMSHDKKKDRNNIHYIYVDEIGSFCENTVEFSDFVTMLKENNGI